MNTFNKILVTSVISLSSLTYAQKQLEITNLPANYGEQLELVGSWTIRNDGTGFIVNGTQIQNKSKSKSTDLILDVYFVPDGTKQSIYSLPNKVKQETNLGQIDGNNNSINNVRTTFVYKDINNLPDGLYKAVVVLRNKKTGEARNHKVLSQTFKAQKNVLSFTNETVKTYLHPNETADEKLTAIYSTIKSSVNLTYLPDQIVLDGNWNLDVDFSTFTVNISGTDNSILNKTADQTDKLKLLVYFTEDEPKDYATIEGYELLNVDIKPIASMSQLKNTKITTNITKPLPAGDYYPLLILTEADDQGNYKIKSVKKFFKKYKL